MLSRRLLLRSKQLHLPLISLGYTVRSPSQPQGRLFSSSATLYARSKKNKKNNTETAPKTANGTEEEQNAANVDIHAQSQDVTAREKAKTPKARKVPNARKAPKAPKIRKIQQDAEKAKAALAAKTKATKAKTPKSMGLREAMLEGEKGPWSDAPGAKRSRNDAQKLDIKTLKAEDLDFKAVEVDVPPVPMLSYGLDRVLFNPGVYRLQDPRSRVYNFDPYLEKIMRVNEFDFKALAPYKTSSKDEDLLELTKRLGSKFTGSTSSMSGILQHFHYLLSRTRGLNHDMLSRSFPKPTNKFSKITTGPSAVFLRWKNGTYAIDADKAYDTPNIMSWLGHSMEKLLTTDQEAFEKYRKSNPMKAPPEDGDRCFHYSSQGNFLMRSQLDAHDPRLPGSGVFDLKTRAVVSIRMNHKEYETGSGYQLRFDRGEWESFEREFYDMTRATMLKYSLQVRMGRMDGIFVAYHNIERIFGFQYLSISDMDLVLHGQTDTCLGDQEFKFSVRLLDELLQKATEKFPEQTLRLHFHTRGERSQFMYIFAEPMTDEQADEIQSRSEIANKKYERDVIGIDHSDEELQEEWKDIQDRVDETIDLEIEGVIDQVKEHEETEDQGNDVRESASELEGTDSRESEMSGSASEAEETEAQEGTAEEPASEIGEGGSKESASEQSESDTSASEIEQSESDTSASESEEGGSEELASKIKEGELEQSEVSASGVEEAESEESPSEIDEVSGDKEAAADQEAITEDSKATQESASASKPAPRGPLIGWTLAIRNRVNGHYVDRPENLTPQHDWTMEYHIKEISEDSCWSLYTKVKERREQLIGEQRQEDTQRLDVYRSIIRRYSDKGRRWREEQDVIDEKMGQRLYEPMGPGSPLYAAKME
ncbi:Pet127-domain-containing protein [Byssothecium circinans]|uniref:Pet127-domain-containing protein n=1 Tax=Byssothecium circinans TaxID=147558 RepID=A0A6A5TWV8_9PLEO|nr:Pet127-domain-containing protein [Byssothecium circinans]